MSAAQASKPLVKIGRRTITVGDFAARLAAQSPYLRARYQSTERKMEFLENMIRFEVLAMEAERRGYAKLRSVRAQQEKMLVQELLKKEVNEKVLLSSIKEADIKRYYDSNPEEFRKPPQVRVSQIVISDKAKASRVLERILEAPDDDERFRELVQSMSEDVSTKSRSGDLRFFSKPKERGENEPAVPKAVARASFTLEQVGDLYPKLVQSSQGYHILKLTGKRDALQRSLDDVRRVVQHKLWRQRREGRAKELVAELREKAHIEEFPEVLKDIKVKQDSGKTSDK